MLLHQSGNDMVEDKMRCCVSGSFETRYSFDPFGKVIYFHDNLLVSITRCKMKSHEVYAPFAEGSMVMIGCKRVRGAHVFFSQR
jgi:hypothetical protein